MDERPRNHKLHERHEVTLFNRQAVQVSGVLNVESFDANEFVLQTSYGLLVIRGENLHIKALNLENGLVSIEGVVFDLGYFDDKASPGEKAKGFFSKIFK